MDEHKGHFVMPQTTDEQHSQRLELLEAAVMQLTRQTAELVVLNSKRAEFEQNMPGMMRDAMKDTARWAVSDEVLVGEAKKKFDAVAKQMAVVELGTRIDSTISGLTKNAWLMFIGAAIFITLFGPREFFQFAVEKVKATVSAK